MSPSDVNAAGGNRILAVNAGSSSIKFGLFSSAARIELILEGGITGIGTDAAAFEVCETGPDGTFCREFGIPDRVAAVNVLADWLSRG